MTAPALSAFGKLPSAGDFVQIGPQPDALRALDLWIERGLFVAHNRLGDGWEAHLAAMPTWSFVFAPADTRHVLLGAARFSTDRVGRTYPFGVTLALERAALDPREAPSWPVRWRRFFEQAAALVRQAVAEAPPPDALAADLLPPLAATTEPTPPDAHQRRLAETPATSVWGAIWQDDPALYARLSLAHLAHHLRPLRQRDPSRFTLGLRCALPASAAERASDVAFWTEVAWALLGRPRLWPTLFWVAEDHAPSDLLLFLRAPLPQAFPALIDDQGAYDRVVPLDQPRGPTPPPEPAGLEPPLSLRRLIDHLNHA